ncbi:hypothetical protein Glove_219g146 [Diversispora epigaea]|uniref:Laccase n=1 Tax=Diversispora epigaea TaxID=1348612 RepID=A0A397IPD9_9GLOM|nr:hypothetical protein Glove_219g146 [Diversispora epigaea]
MKFKIFSILGAVLCGFLAAIATPIESEEPNELKFRFAPKPYLFDPLPKLKESSNVTRYYHFELKVVKLSPDGYERPVWTVNGQYPGPLIQANKGDRLVVNVTNNCGDPATIHWHGIFRPGTFWYHSHYYAQYVDGLVGSFIVHDPEDPYCHFYDEEYVITVSDWYHSPSGPLLVKLLEPKYDGKNPYPDSSLISGVGQYNCSEEPGCYCNPNVPPATYNVQKGKKYRFRIINTSANAGFAFSIDNHPLKVIEVEGTPVKNVNASVVNVLPIHIAQRYSVIITADKPCANYYIRANNIQDCLRTDNTTINYNPDRNLNAVGILHYSCAGSNKPKSTPYPTNITDCFDINDDVIRPYKDSPAPSIVTDCFTFRVTQEKNDDLVKLFGINNSSFEPAFNDPTNKRIMQGDDFTKFDENQNAYGYDNPEGCVQITLFNSLDGNHPFHLHGHLFWMIAQGNGSHHANITKYNLENPIIRDTAMIPKHGHLVIRYIADNPGVWAFHCYIEWHVEMGLVAQLIERPSEFSNQTLPNEVRELCVQYNSYEKQRRSTALPRDSTVNRMRMPIFRRIKN